MGPKHTRDWLRTLLQNPLLTPQLAACLHPAPPTTCLCPPGETPLLGHPARILYPLGWQMRLRPAEHREQAAQQPQLPFEGGVWFKGSPSRSPSRGSRLFHPPLSSVHPQKNAPRPPRGAYALSCCLVTWSTLHSGSQGRVRLRAREHRSCLSS